MTTAFRQTFVLSAAGALVGYLLSYAGHASAEVGWAAAAATVALFIILWRRSPAAGFAVLLTELVAGSLGRLLLFPYGISVRIALFGAAVLLAVRSHERRARLKNDLLAFGIRGPLTLVAIAVTLGVLRGLRNPASALIGDANAYAYLLLLLPLLEARRDAQFRDRTLGAVMGAATACTILTLGAFFLFTHATPEPVLRSLYTWVRDQGLGEITRAPGGFYRVFFQAHVWNVIAFLLGVPLVAMAPRGRSRFLLAVTVALSVSVLFVSFSRTFWIAAAVAVVIQAFFLFRTARFRAVRLAYTLAVAGTVLAGVAVPFLLSRSVGSATAGRLSEFSSGAAADSRMSLLHVLWPAILERPMLGWGFGRELTYVTRDPRLLAYFPDGRYTTYAFEWGWLDFWFKMGLLGPIAFFLLVASVADRLRRAVRVEEVHRGLIAVGLLSALAFVSVAHVFSPWLNHPLGIGLVLLAAVWPVRDS